MEACPSCEANDQPNCGNSHCFTNEVKDEKEWVADCSSCGAKELASWSQVIEDGCPICGSHSISIYHKKNLKEE